MHRTGEEGLSTPYIEADCTFVSASLKCSTDSLPPSFRRIATFPFPVGQRMMCQYLRSSRSVT